LEIEIFNKAEDGRKKDEIICVRRGNLFTKMNLHEGYNSYTFNLSDNVSIVTKNILSLKSSSLLSPKYHTHT